MLDSIYHMTMMTLKLLRNHIFGVKKSQFCLFASFRMDNWTPSVK